MAITLLKQVIIMMILSGFGLGLFKAKKISLEGSKTLGNILICVSLPCVIVNGFLIERTTERIIGLILSALAALVLLAVAIFISRVVMKKDAIAVFAVATMPLIIQLATMFWDEESKVKIVTEEYVLTDFPDEVYKL